MRRVHAIINLSGPSADTQPDTNIRPPVGFTRTAERGRDLISTNAGRRCEYVRLHLNCQLPHFAYSQTGRQGSLGVSGKASGWGGMWLVMQDVSHSTWNRGSGPRPRLWLSSVTNRCKWGPVGFTPWCIKEAYIRPLPQETASPPEQGRGDKEQRRQKQARHQGG